jgi:hypothetical protein
MKVLKCGFGLALIAGLTLNASCGGSGSDSAGASSAGESSSGAGAGNESAGASSVAGDTSSASGGSMDQGGASMGGSVGRGGMGRAGTSASGGASVSNPADCPMANLAANAMCAVLASNMERCVYGDESCHCRLNNGGGGANQGGAGGAPTTDSGRWMCTGLCPTTKPTVGADCMSGQACQYVSGNCFCGGSQKWQCNGAMMGGGGAGGDMGSAGAGGRNAAGGMTGAGGAGGAGGAPNNGTVCPAQKPMTTGACMGTGVCVYPNKTGCACVNDKWLCD